jgi:Ala-tRNA(Pro) deacylase
VTAIAQRVRKLLDDERVAYETIHHEEDFTAPETAPHTHTPGRAFAKAVVVRVGDEYAMAVLPAHHDINFERLSEILGHKRVKLASEKQIKKLCPDCEAGAVPPFGNLYDLPVYASPILAESEKITVVAGSHSEAVRLAWRDYETLVKPELRDFSDVGGEGPPTKSPAGS